MLEPFDTLILYWRLRPQPQPRENARVSSSELDELSAPTFDDELPSVAQVAGMPRALTLTWLCAQLTVTEVLSSLSTVMLTPQPADAGCVEAPTTPVAARAEATRRVLSFMGGVLCLIRRGSAGWGTP